MKTKAIIFDFDGTLADTAPCIVVSAEHSFLRHGLTPPTEARLRQTIGLPLVESVRVAGDISLGDAEKVSATYLELFKDFELDYVKLFPGVKETLQTLRARGLRMAIASSREAASLDRLLCQHGIDSFFETKVVDGDHIPAKPAPDMVLALLERMHLKADEVIVVGDTIYDISMGKGAHCRTVAVTFGNHSRKQLEEVAPDLIIDSFPDMLDFVD